MTLQNKGDSPSDSRELHALIQILMPRSWMVEDVGSELQKVIYSSITDTASPGEMQNQHISQTGWLWSQYAHSYTSGAVFGKSQ